MSVILTILSLALMCASMMIAHGDGRAIVVIAAVVTTLAILAITFLAPYTRSERRIMNGTALAVPVIWAVVLGVVIAQS